MGCKGTGMCFLTRLGGGTAPINGWESCPLCCVDPMVFDEEAGVIEATEDGPEECNWSGSFGVGGGGCCGGGD